MTTNKSRQVARWADSFWGNPDIRDMSDCEDQEDPSVANLPCFDYAQKYQPNAEYPLRSLMGILLYLCSSTNTMINHYAIAGTWAERCANRPVSTQRRARSAAVDERQQVVLFAN